jgi:DNA-binding transcriptional MocR family regulator
MQWPWLGDFDLRNGPKYVAIVRAIEQAIRSGALRPGERLPAQRDLAQALDVDLTTVTRAYGIARDTGLIEGSGRLGSFVRNDARPQVSGESEASGMIMPPQPAFALLPDAIRTGLARLLRAGGVSPLLEYQPSGGGLHDRRQAAAALTARGMPTAEDEVVLAAGGQNALHAILSTALSPGDSICAGRSVYPGLLALAARLGLRVIPLPPGTDGIDTEALERAARQGAKALYVVPTNDNPTTLTLALETRQRIAQVAQHHGLTIIEDDAYGQLPAHPLPAIASFAPASTWHIASVSKILSPVLRVAFVRAPSADQAHRLAADIHETAIMAPPLNAALVTAWLRDGTFHELVAAVRAEGVARQRIAAKHLAGLDYAAHAEGYHIWLRLPGDVHAAALAASLSPAGLSIVPGASFAADKAQAEQAVRISIGGAMTHDRLHTLLGQLRGRLAPS